MLQLKLCFGLWLLVGKGRQEADFRKILKAGFSSAPSLELRFLKALMAFAALLGLRFPVPAALVSSSAWLSVLSHWSVQHGEMGS